MLRSEKYIFMTVVLITHHFAFININLVFFFVYNYRFKKFTTKFLFYFFRSVVILSELCFLIIII